MKLTKVDNQPVTTLINPYQRSMKVTLQRLNDAVHFEAKNEDGNTIHLDGSPEVGGEGQGRSPHAGAAHEPCRVQQH